MSKGYTDYQKCSEAELVKCCQEGDREAENALCKRYWEVLHTFFKQEIGKNNADAKDLVQETFIEALGSLTTLLNPNSFRWWLRTIAKRILARWIAEKQKRSGQVALDAALDVPSARDLDPADTQGQTTLGELLIAPVVYQPEHGVLDDEFRNIRRRFEETLRPEDRRLFRLRHHDRMKFRKIANKLGIKEGTVKVQHHRLLKKFKTWLEKHYPEYLPLVKWRGGVISWMIVIGYFRLCWYNVTK